MCFVNLKLVKSVITELSTMSLRTEDPESKLTLGFSTHEPLLTQSTYYTW